MLITCAFFSMWASFTVLVCIFCYCGYNRIQTFSCEIQLPCVSCPVSKRSCLRLNCFSLYSSSSRFWHLLRHYIHRIRRSGYCVRVWTGRFACDLLSYDFSLSFTKCINIGMRLLIKSLVGCMYEVLYPSEQFLAEKCHISTRFLLSQTALLGQWNLVQIICQR